PGSRTAGLAAAVLASTPPPRPRPPLAAFSPVASQPGWLPPRPCQGLPGPPLCVVPEARKIIESAPYYQALLTEDPDGPYLHAAEPRWAQLADLQCVVQVARLDQVVAADGLLGLDERAVGDHVAANRGGRAGRLQRPALDDLPALFRDLLG